MFAVPSRGAKDFWTFGRLSLRLGLANYIESLEALVLISAS
jgi:hypothetical protein